MKKKLPKMKNDRQTEDLLSEDLADYLHRDNFKRVSFEFAPKDKSITIRISAELLETVQRVSEAHNMGYQKYIREVLEAAVMRGSKAPRKSRMAVPPKKAIKGELSVRKSVARKAAR